MRRPKGLATRLMTAQVLVIAIGALTLVVAATLLAPRLFSDHLARIGEYSPDVRLHAEEAFVSSFALSLVFATTVSLATAGLVSWFLVGRVARPVAALADAADAVALGRYQVQVPRASFSSELLRLSDAFAHMAFRLTETDASRTALLSDLAHELRTPLATLEAYVDGMEDGVVEVVPESWGTMREQIQRLRRLAGDLREIAAAEEHALGLVLIPVDARAVAEAAVAAARPRYRAKTVDLQLDGGHPTYVLADRERLLQVLANLLDNALRHTPAHGTVRVSVDESGGRVSFRISDDGEGIATDQLDSIFRRFHRGDPARVSGDGGGSGLGLTIARAIVTEHGGDLTAASEGPGRGSAFTVSLLAQRGGDVGAGR